MIFPLRETKLALIPSTLQPAICRSFQILYFTAKVSWPLDTAQGLIVDAFLRTVKG